MVRITSWNVNGIRNPFSYQPWSQNRTFQAMFEILEADIVVMQETKIQRKDLRDDMVLVPGWDVHFSLPRHKKGYSGVAVYTRTATCCPIRSEEGVTGVLTPPNSSTRFRDLSPEQQIGGYPRAGQLSGIVDDVTLDSEGRCIILEFPAFVLLGIYSPANRDESRDEFRIGFLEALDVRIRNLVAEGKQVILTGDLNVIRDEIDSANLVDHLKKAEITVEKFLSTASRRLFNHLVFDGRVFGARDEGRDKPVLWDLCRLYHPKRKGMFTCWDTKKNLRPANNGSRIDYVLCSDGIRSWFSDADIQEGLIGSDHCPIFARLKDWVMVDGVEKSILDVMNPEGMFKGGERLREWSTKDLLPSSAKLIPEFDRRRNIKDMFTTKHTPMSRPQTSIPSPAAVGSASRSSGPATVLTDPQVQSGMSAATPTKTTNQVSQGPKSPQDPPKRLAPSPKVSKFQKKAKVAQPVGPGQSTLKSFFQPKASLTAPSAPATPRDLPPVAGTSTVRNQDDDTYGNIEHATRRITDMPLEDDTVFDPIANKDSWSKLMKKRLPPRCEHDERCITLTTKKPGVNNGRSFFICPRPLGPSGEKEKDTQWRCGTFMWCSDWTEMAAEKAEEDRAKKLFRG